MALESSVNDVFRFIQLRPRRPVGEAEPIPLIEDTQLAESIVGAPSFARRTALANTALERRTDTARSVDDIRLGREITTAVVGLRGQEGVTTDDLIQAIPELDSELDDEAIDAARRALSNTLLASFFATRSFPSDLRALQDVFRVYHVLTLRRADAGMAPLPLAALLERPILSPTVRRNAASIEIRARAEVQPPIGSRIALAIAELEKLDRPGLLVESEEDGDRSADRPFALTAAARALVSAETNAILAELGIALAAVPIDVVIQTLAAAKAREPSMNLVWPEPLVVPATGTPMPPSPAQALVRPAGVADLLVVKQQIKRYEAGEIAHVENVLIGETKSRAHRQLDRTEETFVTETELTRMKETELETADRFELNRETARTLKEDQKIGFGLSLSGKYGTAIEYSSNFEMDLAKSTEETAKHSSRFARDVVSRSLERVTERVREQRTRTVIRETEETNLHELKNEDAAHVRGIYQFVDKIYETQVFNYGLREMFDFMVPEPASFLWYVEEHPSLDVELPPAPPKLELLAPDASYIDEDNALALAATYDANGVEAPPPRYRMLTAGLKHGEDDVSESGQPHSSLRVEVQIPAGYRPLRARIRLLAFTDEDPIIAVAIGSQRRVWAPKAGDRTDLSAGIQLAHKPTISMRLDTEPYELGAENKLGILSMAWETNTYSLEAVIVAKRTDEELARWRIGAYNKIRAAYNDQVRSHEQRSEEIRSRAAAQAEQESRRPFGAPPAENKRTINAELKKHCISIITQQRYDTFDATKDDTPPYFDFAEAAEEGAYIRFFEQAFEWDQMQYVFYPYFWARKTSWIDRFIKQDVDPQFLEFLKAGAARVVVPARPGFEVAVTHFIETGKIWGGEGEPPQINSPLYVSIVDEIRERTGAPQGEIAVGEAWEARVPTALVLVREAGDLPEWERVVPDEWIWRPVEAG